MELMKITKKYSKINHIECVSVFILLLLLSSCRKNKDISEFVVDHPYETKVEYMKDTIKLTDISLNDPSENNSYIWVKKNGQYYDYDHLIMSMEEHTEYFSTRMYSESPIKGVYMIRKEGKNLYSYKTYLEVAPHHWKLNNAIYYDKSYRIIKFQDMFACDFILKK